MILLDCELIILILAKLDTVAERVKGDVGACGDDHVGKFEIRHPMQRIGRRKERGNDSPASPIGVYPNKHSRHAAHLNAGATCKPPNR